MFLAPSEKHAFYIFNCPIRVHARRNEEEKFKKFRI